MVCSFPFEHRIDNSSKNFMGRESHYEQFRLGHLVRQAVPTRNIFKQQEPLMLDEAKVRLGSACEHTLPQ